MKHKNVVIRKRSDVDLLDRRIKRALTTNKPGTEIPVYYKYCQEATTSSMVDDPTKFVGKAMDIHENAEGDIVCTVITNDMLTITAHFQGVIDNFIIIIEPDSYGNTVPKLKQLIIYDKDFKKQVDARRAAFLKARTDAPIEGVLPVPRMGMNPLKNKEVQDKIQKDIDNFKNEGGTDMYVVNDVIDMDEEKTIVAMEVAGAESIPECNTQPTETTRNDS